MLERVGPDRPGDIQALQLDFGARNDRRLGHVALVESRRHLALVVANGHQGLQVRFARARARCDHFGRDNPPSHRSRQPDR
jgi:hypothetical protein